MIRVELVSSSIQEICYSYHRRHVMRKPAFLHIQKANAQMNCKVSEFLFLVFLFSIPEIDIFCGCTARVVSDLV